MVILEASRQNRSRVLSCEISNISSAGKKLVASADEAENIAKPSIVLEIVRTGRDEKKKFLLIQTGCKLAIDLCLKNLSRVLVIPTSFTPIQPAFWSLIHYGGSTRSSKHMGS